MAENYKYSRLSSDIKNKINEIIDYDIDDLDFVTVTNVELTKDMQDMKVYVQSLSSSQEAYVLKVLKSKEGFIKRKIANSIQMRKMPSLIFKYDHSLENYNKVDELLNGE